jgi:ketosteroid isomerase-like protein
MSEQEQQIIELVKKGYEAFAAGDVDAVMSLLDDNIEWVQPGDSTISGTYHGKGEIGEYLSRLAEKSVTVKLNRLLADGDMVVALTEVAVGDERCQDADLFTLRDGKTVRVQVHTDTALMERVYGKKQVAAG